MSDSEITNITKSALRDIDAACNVEELEAVYTKYLGRKGFITQFLRSISSLPMGYRPVAGKRTNEAKKIVEATLNRAYKHLRARSKISANNESRIRMDVSLPGRKRKRGHLHPITKVMSRICSIFLSIGFEVIEGPEVETDYYNFEALNLPKNHPARDMQDTFYVSPSIVLRTHTSSTQPRVMENTQPPIQILAPGKVYRCDSDITHTPMFHQVEGLFVDTRVSFGDLKGIISMFMHQLFGNKKKLRFRPSFFPFTEPSAEVDIACVICSGSGCRVCSQTGWLEVMGSGMVHPAVFEKVGYDTTKYTGFAFGMGVERIAMLKYRVDDIRRYFDNDFRFLAQF